MVRRRRIRYPPEFKAEALRRDVHQLRQERDILKKAAAFFAKQTE